ncbi:TetR family transcriptional regulator [Paraburkholderia acidicola]|uniref:TetR family transcriptional regulator n=1 Tax=Paraburkholderia acidicola TaxID=1912599 RepID=A0A2A4EU77_9BURK|nr:TetR/AcrR family transcriptional regulator C-terminal domain-containing protein [Paraburkholderia acidicola]PCE23992.1 TetR family transcriptional regulator [Paraburkholderia acidicola]
MAIQKEQVIEAAIELLDELGIEGVTMRKLAQALDIKAASLYWHFENKQVLMDGMADLLMENVARKMPRNRTWEEQLRQVSGEIRRAMLKHRDGARVFAGSNGVTENVMRVGNALMASLVEAGADSRLAAWGSFSVLYYVLGFVMEEQALGPDNGIDLKARQAAFVALANTDYPHAYDAASDIFNRNFDQRFALGIDLLIRGIESRIADA